MAFPVVMYRCESWTKKKAECQRIDAFEFFEFEVFWTLSKTRESLGLQGDPTSQSQRKSVLNIHWKDWSWSFNALATQCKEQTHWKRLWCWKGLKARGEEGNSGWDGWTWVWANSGRKWRTGEPGMLQIMGWQRVRCDIVTDYVSQHSQHIYTAVFSKYDFWTIRWHEVESLIK